MSDSKYWKTLAGLIIAGVLGIAATPGARAQGAQTQGAQAQGARSWCIQGSGDLYACGFASYEQCELARDGVAMCIANGQEPQPGYVEADRLYRAATANAMLNRNANARLVGPVNLEPVKKRHAR